MTETKSNQQWDPDQYAENVRFVSDLGMPVVELLAPVKGEHILDLGCGDGALTIKLLEYGCTVRAVDSSAEMISAARKLGLDAEVVDGHNLKFRDEFDAVFSSAAMHWMTSPEKVIDGVWRALHPGGRFVGEFGGYGNVAQVVSALESSLVQRELPVNNPWFFPDTARYCELLENRGFEVTSIVLIPRPTPLPGGIAEWLDIMAQSFFSGVPADDLQEFKNEVAGKLKPVLSDGKGNWFVDYVRLRFRAES